jgi:hypothetical protein
LAKLAGKGDVFVASRRFIKTPFWAVAATSFAAVGMIMSPATALADKGEDSPQCMFPQEDGTCPIPGTSITRSATTGVALAGPSAVRGAQRGVPWSDGDDASAQQLILINNGNPVSACFAAGFQLETCGFDTAHGIPQLP